MSRPTLSRRHFLAASIGGLAALAGCSDTGNTGTPRVETRTVVIHRSPGPTPTPRVVTKTVPVTPAEKPTPRVRTVIIERTVIRTPEPTPLPDAPVVKNVYLSSFVGLG